MAKVNLRESTAGIAAAPGNCTPRASVTHAMVEAVPIVMHEPWLRAEHDSIAINSSKLILPLLTCSLYFQTKVPEPTGWP